MTDTYTYAASGIGAVMVNSVYQNSVELIPASFVYEDNFKAAFQASQSVFFAEAERRVAPLTLMKQNPVGGTEKYFQASALRCGILKADSNPYSIYVDAKINNQEKINSASGLLLMNVFVLGSVGDEIERRRVSVILQAIYDFCVSLDLRLLVSGWPANAASADQKAYQPEITRQFDSVQIDPASNNQRLKDLGAVGSIGMKFLLQYKKNNQSVKV